MIRQLKCFLNVHSIALAAVGAVLAGSSLIAAEPHCRLQNAVMTGTYVTSGSGTITGVGPLASVGLVVYNGDGTGTLLSGTNVINGSSSTLANIPATFTVNSDCTGSKTIGTGASAVHFNFVISPDGSTITWIVTDPGVTMLGVATRLKGFN